MVRTINIISFACLTLSACNTAEPAAPKPVPEPKTTVDTTYLPVLNVEFLFPEKTSDGDMIRQIAEATKTVAMNLHRSTAEGRSLTAVNFTAAAGVERPAMQLHFTIPAADLLKAASSRKQAGYYLTLTNEAGANTVEGREAARNYCNGANVAFCEQIT